MLTLSFDASTGVLSVALLKGSACLDQILNRERKTHAGQLMPAIDSILKRNNLSVPDLDLVCAGHGPGSYTGIRIALATALGLTAGTSTPLMTVSTLQAMTPAVSETLVFAVLDARGGRVFAGGYRQDEVVYADRQTTVEELSTHILNTYRAEPVTLAGNGAALTAPFLKTANLLPEAFPDAARLGRLGQLRFRRQGRGLRTEEVRAFYAAPTQAERLAGES